MRISDWGSDVCSSDLLVHLLRGAFQLALHLLAPLGGKRDARRLLLCLGLRRHGHAPSAVLTGSWLRSTPQRRSALPGSGARNCQGNRSKPSRSEERRVGKECVSTFRSRWSQDHSKKKQKNKQTQNTTNSQQISVQNAL